MLVDESCGQTLFTPVQPLAVSSHTSEKVSKIILEINKGEGGTKTIQLKSNTAVIIGAMYAGCDCFFGYPITPASEVLHESLYFPKVGRTFVQRNQRSLY